jgi:hypothetical protein
VWHLIFCNQPGYDLSPSTFLNNETAFVYPLNITWRIPFSNYFYCTSGILEYSHTPQLVTHHIRAGNGFLLIEDSAEAHVERSHLSVMHTYFEHNKIPPNKVIYLTGCMNATQLYEYWCLEQGIKDKMHIISFPVSQDSLAIYFTTYNPKVPEYDTERVPEKLFLAWNRRFRPHRVALAFGLDKLGLADRSYISMGLTDPETSSYHVTHAYNGYFLENFNVTSADVNAFVQKLPLVLDGKTDTVQMCQDFDDSTRPYYQNSLVSLITETNFDASEVSLTEKSFKPVKEKHPFISVGAPGTLRALKDMGFKTFNEFWDESYDNEGNSKARITKILNICKEISAWDSNKIIEFRRKVKPILDHNYEKLKIRYAAVVAQTVRDKITEVVNKKGVQ